MYCKLPDGVISGPSPSLTESTCWPQAFERMWVWRFLAPTWIRFKTSLSKSPPFYELSLGQWMWYPIRWLVKVILKLKSIAKKPHVSAWVLVTFKMQLKWRVLVFIQPASQRIFLLKDSESFSWCSMSITIRSTRGFEKSSSSRFKILLATLPSRRLIWSRVAICWFI